MFISFVHLLSSKRLPSVKIASRGCGVGRGGGGWGWRGRILDPAVGDDEKAGKPSSWHNLLQFFWQSLKCTRKLATSSPTKVVNNFLLREMDRKTSSFSMTLLFIICQSNFSFYDWPILIFCPHWLIKWEDLFPFAFNSIAISLRTYSLKSWSWLSAILF